MKKQKGELFMETIIKTQNLCKSYGNASVLSSINLDVEKGDFIGLLGTNGAGKTTLLKMLCGLLEPSEGEALVLGNSPWTERDQVLENLGVMIETPVFYDHLTAHENLKIHLEYLGKDADIDEILKSVGLTNIDGKPVGKFSLGMRQKLAIARAISHNPAILLLDEPINGLDPVAIKEMRDLFISLKEKGTTIILSSHILGEILHTVENVIVVSNGTLQPLGSIADLQNKYGDETENYLIERMRG